MSSCEMGVEKETTRRTFAAYKCSSSNIKDKGMVKQSMLVNQTTLHYVKLMMLLNGMIERNNETGKHICLQCTNGHSGQSLPP